VIHARRYLCRACDVTITVVPRGVVPTYLYTGCAIALALALWGISREPADTVRHKVSPWSIVGPGQAGRWRSLGRWVRAIAAGRLFPDIGRVTGAGAPRALAARFAEVAIGRASPADRAASLWHRAWRGGESMA
jgi:hypothetical protein